MEKNTLYHGSHLVRDVMRTTQTKIFDNWTKLIIKIFFLQLSSRCLLFKSMWEKKRQQIFFTKMSRNIRELKLGGGTIIGKKYIRKIFVRVRGLKGKSIILALISSGTRWDKISVFLHISHLCCKTVKVIFSRHVRDLLHYIY